MSSCLLKLMEKILNERLLWWLEHNQIIHDTQFGFRMNRSCIDSLAALISDIHKQFYRKEHLAAVFIDIKGAYDNVNPEIMLNYLLELKMPRSFIIFIHNLISERNIHFINIPGDISRYTFKGLPQGSVLSPTLFSLYINNLEKVILPEVKILKFADDLAIYSSGSSIDSSLKRLEQQTEIISEELSNRDLELSPDKCKLVIFNSSNVKIGGYKIVISNTTITPSSHVKFLGMVLDKQLNWNLHIKYIIQKCDVPIRILCCIRRTWWGADPCTMLVLYKSLIRSRIEYGGFLISPCNPNQFYKLEKIQLKCLRLAMGYMNSTPTNVITEESKVLLLEYRFELLCIKYLLRSLGRDYLSLLDCLEEIKDLAEHPLYSNNFNKSTLVYKYEEIGSSANIIYRSSINIYHTLDFKNQLADINIDLLSGESMIDANNANALFQDTFYSKLPTFTFIFTDGSVTSRTDDGAMVGVASWSANEQFTASYKIYDLGSIFTAEATALHQVLKLILSAEVSNFLIFLDCKSILKAIANGRNLRHQSYLIQEIYELLIKCKEKNKVIQLVWIPSHCGIAGNEMVDGLAKQAAREGTFLDQALPHSDVVCKFKAQLIAKNRNALNMKATRGLKQRSVIFSIV
ncbi:PREDICTED: RNA-directed DNA polymerase from mobile element jockey-like [Cyphomyrmex costatus]|uniref:RNA-directed DNA polymerase from mobile element jockey-like n=1 Tax=Cyphomyrmex costatus TaxID=456900 RepID=UPI00085220F6|nr:PREDICTED: RNA-directed DNA polymerase from mobile element jockey-like [Cyphomyrmex costatus]